MTLAKPLPKTLSPKTTPPVTQAETLRTPLRAILFDKDGTFVDFHATWSPTAFAVMRRLAPDEAALERLIDYNRYDRETGLIGATSPMVANSSADYGVEWARLVGAEPTPDFLTRLDALFFEEGLANVAPIGDPAAVFGALREAGYRLGVVTNDSERGARSQCEKLGLTGWFDAIIGYDTGHGRKPESGQILAFGRDHGFAPHEMALVGDTLHDVHAARAAGAVAIAVLTGFATREDFSGLAHHVVPDISHLPALLAPSPSAAPGR